MIELVRDLKAMNILATFQNDPWKFRDVRVLMVIFHVRSWKMWQKIRQKKILATEKTRYLYQLACLDPPICQIWWL